MVFILDSNGNKLAPTNRHGRVRRLIRSGAASIVSYIPFTIQLNYQVEDINKAAPTVKPTASAV